MSRLRRRDQQRAGRAGAKPPVGAATALHVRRSWRVGGAAAAGAGGSPRSSRLGPRGVGCGCSSSCHGSPEHTRARPETPGQPEGG